MTTTTWRLVPAKSDQAPTVAFAARGPRIGGAARNALLLAAHRLRPSPGDEQGKGLVPHLLRQGLVVRRSFKKTRNFHIDRKSFFQPGNGERGPIVRKPMRAQAFHDHQPVCFTGILRNGERAFKASYKRGGPIHGARPF